MEKEVGRSLLVCNAPELSSMVMTSTVPLFLASPQRESLLTKYIYIYCRLELTYQGVYHYFDNREVLHSLDHCLLDTGDQYVHLKTATPLTQVNQAEIKFKRKVMIHVSEY